MAPTSPGVKRFAGKQPPRPAALLLFGGAAVGIIALHLATNGTLGFHTDELYYLDCGRHPAFGYVDFPPIVPLLARLETGFLGISPWTLGLLPTLLGGVMVALSGAYVRRLGGSPRLQALALLIAVVAPYFRCVDRCRDRPMETAAQFLLIRHYLVRGGRAGGESRRVHHGHQTAGDQRPP